MDRYFVTAPVMDGYSWYDIRDRDKLNIPLVSIFKELPSGVSPEVLAENLCYRFNHPLEDKINVINR